MTTDPQTRPPDPPPSSGVLRFALTAGAWFIGLFGLMRLGWVERQLLLPFAQLQERVADQLTGAQTDAVYVDASCSGGDAMALCLGAVLAFPATWSARLRGAGIGLLVIAAFNIVRIGNLSLVAAYPSLLDLLHIYTSGQPSSSWWRSRMCTPGCVGRWDLPSTAPARIPAPPGTALPGGFCCSPSWGPPPTSRRLGGCTRAPYCAPWASGWP